MKEKTKIFSIDNHEEGKIVTGFSFLRVFAILVKSFRFSIVRIFPFSTYFLSCSILRIPKKISKKLLKIFEKNRFIRLHKFKGFEVDTISLENFIKKNRKEVERILKKEELEIVLNYIRKIKEFKVV
jgi:hypothetical protein